MTGRVIRARGRLFTVLAEGIEYQCEVLKKVKARERVTPVAVGDSVDFAFVPPGPGAIESVRPRRTKFSRPRVGSEAKQVEQVIAANLSQMIIVASVAQPTLKLHLIDRFTVSATKGNLKPAVVVNKIDLEHDIDLDRLRAIYGSAGIKVVLTSCLASTGIDEFRELLRNQESILVGHSGVGKTSLLNSIQPGLGLRTQRTAKTTGKGKHTTTSVELFPLECGGFVADTPGLKVMGLWKLDANELDELFPEFGPHLGLCRFRRCSHIHEPQCVVKQAVSEGEVFPERYESYVKIYSDLQE